MRSRVLLMTVSLRALLSGAVVLCLAVTPAPAQPLTPQPVSTAAPGGCLPLPPSCATPSIRAPGEAPVQPFPSTTGAMGTGTDLALGGGLSAAAGGETVALNGSAYVDDAVPFTHIRLRFDAAYNDNRPDRAEFFYPKCGCFRNAPAPFTDPHAAGPPLPELRVDYQEISTYFEYAVGNRFSAFIDLPVRFLNPEVNSNATGFGDMSVGAKLALISSDDTVVTFQGRVYIPTGDGDRGLGTDHTSLEPALLLYQRLGDRLGLQAELRDWIPIGGSDFAGNVLRYGFALTYLAYSGSNFRVMPVGELVGWSVLGGKEEDNLSGAVLDADGDTIVNAKFGVRLGFGDLQERGLLSQSDLYVGYGRALTGAVWYKDILRVEYRMRF